jgi:hypothetical protein
MSVNRLFTVSYGDDSFALNLPFISQYANQENIRFIVVCNEISHPAILAKSVPDHLLLPSQSFPVIRKALAVLRSAISKQISFVRVIARMRLRSYLW